MESEDQDKRQKWSPWGQAFAQDDWIKLPRSIYLVLDEMGFKGCYDRVVITIFRRIWAGQTRVKFSQKDIANEANVSVKTVYTVLKIMEGTKEIPGGAVRINPTDYYRRSEYELGGFIARMENTFNDMKARNRLVLMGDENE